jgi:hypothetical protein
MQAPPMIEIVAFPTGFQAAVVELILPIQREEFGFPVTVEDQPDLVAIPGLYQFGAGGFGWHSIRGSIGSRSCDDTKPLPLAGVHVKSWAPVSQCIQSFRLSQPTPPSSTAVRCARSPRKVASAAACRFRRSPKTHLRSSSTSELGATEQAHPGVDRFELTTNTVVPGNVAFYERRGYKVDELTTYTDKIVLAQMSKVRDGKTSGPAIKLTSASHLRWLAAAAHVKR